MIGLLQAAAAAVRDPLVVTLFVLLLGGLLTHLLFRRHPLSRATLRVIFLVGLTIVLIHAEVVPYEPQTRTGVPFQDATHAALKIAWRRISAPVDGYVLGSSWTVTLMLWMLEGELVLTILALAMVLFGTIAKSLVPVKTWVARQFISMTRPSVLPSMLIQSPGR